MYILEVMCGIKSYMIVLEFVVSGGCTEQRRWNIFSKISLLFKYVYSKLASQNEYQFQLNVIVYLQILQSKSVPEILPKILQS